MKSKTFQAYLKKRLSKKEIAEIEHLANMEFEAIKLPQKAVSRGISKYMAQEKKSKFCV